jgi:hypothetical protein
VGLRSYPAFFTGRRVPIAHFAATGKTVWKALCHDTNFHVFA